MRIKLTPAFEPVIVLTDMSRNIRLSTAQVGAAR
jgi:hypothetical protein